MKRLTLITLTALLAEHGDAILHGRADELPALHRAIQAGLRQLVVSGWRIRSPQDRVWLQTLLQTTQASQTMLARQRELLALGYPLLAGWSRKSSLGAVTGLDVEQRLQPSVAAALLAVERGARIVRVHDVRETVQALAVWRAMESGQVGAE